MLDFLRIRDLALIEDMELNFTAGLNVLTGETGAGKSFILKALNFLTGEKLQADMVRPGKEKAEVEALFALPDGDIIIRRELLADTGRSRIFLNDKLVSQETIKELRASLLVHTSQHGQQKLLLPSTQTRMLDTYINKPELFAQRDASLAALRALEIQQKELQAKVSNLQEKKELLEFQQKEIDAVAPLANEEDELEALRAAFRAIELSQTTRDEALELLLDSRDSLGLNETLGLFIRSLKHIARHESSAENAPDWKAYTNTLEQSLEILPEIERILRKRPVPPDSQGLSLEQIEKRLFAFSQLKRKMNRTFNDILTMREDIEKNLSFLDTCNLDLRALEREETKLFKELETTLNNINTARQQAAPKLAKALMEELAGLGFSEHVAVHFEFFPQELWHTSERKHEPEAFAVEQRARLLWIPNPGQQPQPLDKIASGGELSRFLLALTSLTAKEENATLIFDEVDAGVGGLTLNRMAERLATLAKERQLLLITHWPQLAAYGKRHFYIEKQVRQGETFTTCQQLNPDALYTELVRMAGGGAQGEALAKELLAKEI